MIKKNWIHILTVGKLLISNIITVCHSLLPVFINKLYSSHHSKSEKRFYIWNSGIILNKFDKLKTQR
jgi:hypothetical protein